MPGSVKSNVLFLMVYFYECVRIKLVWWFSKREKKHKKSPQHTFLVEVCNPINFDRRISEKAIGRIYVEPWRRKKQK